MLSGGLPTHLLPWGQWSYRYPIIWRCGITLWVFDNMQQKNRLDVGNRNWRAIAAALTMLGTLATTVPAAAQGWSVYRNERFGFSLSYPSAIFEVERTAEAGDGRVFSAPGSDARLLVGALVNEAGYNAARYQEYIAQQSYGQFTIGYRRLGTTWFVLSGERENQIFYEKVMFTCGGRLINSFALIYPRDKRHIFDPIVERVEDTFRPGRDCERAGLSPPSPAPASPSLATYRTRDPSAMADRIARERGHDVVVTWRRTNPPFDLKILRGYASR